MDGRRVCVLGRWMWNHFWVGGWGGLGGEIKSRNETPWCFRVPLLRVGLKGTKRNAGMPFLVYTYPQYVFIHASSQGDEDG